MTFEDVPRLCEIERIARAKNPLTQARYPPHLAGTPEDQLRKFASIHLMDQSRLYRLIGSGRTQARFARNLEDPNQIYLKALVDGQLAGFTIWQPPSSSPLTKQAPPERKLPEEDMVFRADLRADADPNIGRIMLVEHDRLEHAAFPNSEPHW